MDPVADGTFSDTERGRESRRHERFIKTKNKQRTGESGRRFGDNRPSRGTTKPLGYPEESPTVLQGGPPPTPKRVTTRDDTPHTSTNSENTHRPFFVTRGPVGRFYCDVLITSEAKADLPPPGVTHLSYGCPCNTEL